MGVTDVKVVGDSVKELLAKGKVHEAIDLLIAQGYGHHVDIGAFSTGITGGGAGTILDQDQPEALVSIGANTAMIPVRVVVQTETPLIAADADEIEILLAVDPAIAAAAMDPSGATRETVYNMRTDLKGSTSGAVECWSAITANITNPTLSIELAREKKQADVNGVAANAFFEELKMNYEPKHPPILIGNNNAGLAMYLYFGGTVAVVGFAQIEVVVFPADWAKVAA